MSVELTEMIVEPSARSASVHCEWVEPPESERDSPFLVRFEHRNALGGPCPQAFVTLGLRDEAMARALLDAGYGGVLVADAAVLDASVLDRLVSTYGSERIGVAVRAARLRVCWALDCESNSDFRVMRPTQVVPDWEVVIGAGNRTGARLGWWLGEMFDRGIGRAVVSADISDDADMNILAGLTEQFDARLAIELRRSDIRRLRDLIRLCGVRHVVIDWSCRDELTAALAGGDPIASED